MINFINKLKRKCISVYFQIVSCCYADHSDQKNENSSLCLFYFIRLNYHLLFMLIKELTKSVSRVMQVLICQYHIFSSKKVNIGLTFFICPRSERHKMVSSHPMCFSATHMQIFVLLLLTYLAVCQSHN
jgi:hypothetical protein